MKLVQRTVCLILVISIAIGVCGCMNHNEYSDKILSELSTKYNKEFEIVQLTYEVSGNGGNFYRAVCKEAGGTTTFVAYYYLNGSDYLLPDEIDQEAVANNSEPYLVDEYPNLLLNVKMADYLMQEIPGVLFAMTDIHAFNHTLTLADVEKGLEHCVANGEFDAQAKLYLFVDDSIEDKAQYEKELVQKILALNISEQTIDVAYIAKSNEQAVKDAYQDDIYMIEERLEEDEKVVRYSWYMAERGQGIVEKKDVKGV